MSRIVLQNNFCKWILNLAPLQVRKSLNINEIESIEDIYNVDINSSCFSNRIPIFTWGAGPCIIVVLHDRINNCGCVGHISDMIMPGESGTEYNLYRKVFNFIRDRKSVLGRSLDIWFGAGGSFIRSGTEISFIDQISNDLSAVGFEDFIIHDYRTEPAARTDWNPGNIVYFPSRSLLSIIARRDQLATESGLRSIQNKRQAVPNRVWRIPWSFD